MYIYDLFVKNAQTAQEFAWERASGSVSELKDHCGLQNSSYLITERSGERPSVEDPEVWRFQK